MATYQGKSKMSEEEVIQRLLELFGNNLELEIIQSVAFNCGYDVEAASEALLDLQQPAAGTKQWEHKNNFSYSQSVKQNSNTPNDLVAGLENDLKTLTDQFKKVAVTPQPTANRKSKKESEVDRVILHIRQGVRILVLMRGVPGSGKSTLAKKIVNKGVDSDQHSQFILSTDDFFYKPNGTYEHNPSKLPEAHQWNQQRANHKMSLGISPVIIDNTNTQMWEIEPYVRIAVQYGYVVEVLEPYTHWAFNGLELGRRNIHNVPQNKIHDMLHRYERNITPKKIFSMYNLKYTTMKPPLTRAFPKVKFKKPVDQNVTQSAAKPKVTKFKSASKDTVENTYDENREFSFDNLLTNGPSTTGMLQPKICNFNSVMNTTQNSSLSQSSPEAIKITASRFIEPTVKRSDKFPALDFNSWGLPENYAANWESWDVASPLNCSMEHKEIMPLTPNISKPEMKEASTNTSSFDFKMVTSNYEHGDVKITMARGRDINYGVLTIPQLSLTNVKLDKSSMTNDEVLSAVLSRERTVTDVKNVDELVSLFPNVSTNALRDVYEKCEGDLNWVVNLLLDDNGREVLNLKNDTEEFDQKEEILQSSETNTQTSEIPVDDSEDIPTEKVDRSEENLALKRHIEQSIEINKDYYSDHVLKIKNFLHGIKHHEKEPHDYESTSDDSISSNQLEISDDSRHSESSIENPDEEMMELNVGNECVEQLKSKFGNLDLDYLGEFLSVVQVPVTLARQLHAFYLESIYQQMEAQDRVYEMMVTEDAAFAKKLQDKEYEEFLKGQKPEVANLKDIMQEEHTLKLYRKNAEEWKNLAPDDLASKLTRQKLFSAFPSIDQTVLSEILFAHDNNYEQTIDVLLASAAPLHDPDGNIRIPPINEKVLKEMKTAQTESNEVVEDETDDLKTASNYREDANRFLQKRQELFQKAQEAYRKGMTEVALFYSDLAQHQTQLSNQANNMAATSFLHENAKMQNFSTLDLHYLYVKEAISALDIFIDRNINLLKGSKKTHEELFVITGRGNRSDSGRPRIKPAVISRLQKRKIRFVKMNPGLLKIHVNLDTKVTSDVP